MKKRILTSLFVLFATSLYAENANVLPQGRFRARVKPIYAFTFGTQFGNTGQEESLVSDFEVDLDEQTAKKFGKDTSQALQPFFNAGAQTLGQFVPNLDVSTLVLGTAIEYGVTDTLTLGAIVPIISANTKFDLAFNRSPAGSHPALQSTDFAKLAIEKAKAKGYDDPAAWENFGLGDVELGIKYKFLKTSNWSLATKTGLRLPTGKVDDPDKLTDIGFGDGQTDWGATLLVDYFGIPATLLNVMAKYTWQMSDRELLRVPSPDELFTTNVENIQRDLGDRLDLSFYSEVQLWKNFNLNSSYEFFVKQKDIYKSDQGFSVASLQENTAQRKHSLDFGLGFSTLPWVRSGTFRLPLDAGLNFTLPLAGKNVAKATSVNFEYKMYF